MSPRRVANVTRRNLIRLGALAVLFAIVVLAIFELPRMIASSEPAAGAPSAPAVVDLAVSTGAPPSSSPASPASTPVGPIAAPDLPAAIRAAKPSMADTYGKLDEGAASLALWSAQNLTWDALSAIAETSPALFRKDPEEERGKRLCATGTISEIRAERGLSHRLVSDTAVPLLGGLTGATTAASPAATATASGAQPARSATEPDRWAVPSGKIYFALLTPEASGDADRISAPGAAKLVISAVAVRGSGNLVDGSTARFCGILTGVNRHDLPTGGVLTHRAVGMFDLPENR